MSKASARRAAPGPTEVFLRTENAVEEMSKKYEDCLNRHYPLRDFKFVLIKEESSPRSHAATKTDDVGTTGSSPAAEKRLRP